VIGLEIGNFCHVLAAALGLTAILLSSALLFELVKYLGAGYLIYLGIRKLRSPVALEAQVVITDSRRRVFLQSITVAVLNPKTALFFFAFLPQFIDPSRSNVTLQILFLGVIMVAMATLSDSLYALAAGTAGHWLRGSQRFLQVQHTVSGLIYIGLGLTAALAGGSSRK
jgi:threonine/homoserine/homoserine lactone efflux protein